MFQTAPDAGAGDDGEIVPDNSARNDDQGRGSNDIQQSSNSDNEDEKNDRTTNVRGDNQLPSSVVYPAIQPPLETDPPSTIRGREEAGEGGSRLTKAPPSAAVVRVGVWDTATVPSNSHNPLVNSGRGNHFNIDLSGHDGNTAATSNYTREKRHPQPPRETSSPGKYGGDDNEVLSSGDPETPYKYQSLLENSEASELGGGSASPTSSSCYPRLVDRNGCSGGYLEGDGLQEDTTGTRVIKMGTPFPGTPRTDGLDGSLANAAERSLSMEDTELG